jgi:hypothetical protein
MPRPNPPVRHVILYLKKPIGLGDKNIIEGYVVADDQTSFVKIFADRPMKGMSQFFPGHLVEKIEDVQPEKGDAEERSEP